MRYRHRRPTILRSPTTLTTIAGIATMVALALGALGAPTAEAAPYATPETSPDEPAWSELAYTYVRVLDGTATLFPVEPDAASSEPSAPEEVVIHQPVLVGDRLTVDPGARVELVLSDGDLLRIEGPGELIFDAIAGSPETEDTETAIRMTGGEIQLVRLEPLPDESPQPVGPVTVVTPDTRVFLEQAGSYRISSGLSSTRVTVREGLAEMVTDHGSVLVREGDEAIIETGERPRVAFAPAGPEDGLERWGQRLWDEATRAEVGPVDRSLRYSAAGLSRHGEWVHVDGQRAWRPQVEPDWRPYWSGRWEYTPSGYLWVSYEPWGWVPYHYGTWALDPGFGWVWFPGSRFAPAWVYWHWGASHVAWVPIGYYSHYYARHHQGHFGLRFGHYGFAGGLGHHFRHWLFADFHHFRHHDLHHHARPWRDFRHHRRDRHFGDRHDPRTRRDVTPDRGDRVPRGIVTTDSRGFGPGEGAPRRLSLRRGGPDGRENGGGRIGRKGVGGDLPDVTPFIAREPTLSPDLQRRLVTRQPERRLAGTPLAPGTEAPRTLSARRPSPRTRTATPTTTPTDRSGLRGARPDSRRITPRGATPRSATPRDSSRATTPRRVTPRGDTRDNRDGIQSRTPRAPIRVTPRAERTPRTERAPRTESREPLRPRTVTPRAVGPRSETPRSQRPRTETPRTRRPEADRSGGGDSGRESLRPRTVRPRSVQPRSQQPRSVRPSTPQPRTVRPERRPPSSRSPSARTPSNRRPEARGPSTRRPSTRQPSTRSPSPRRPTVKPRSSSGVRRDSPSTSRRTPRSSVRSRPRDSQPTPRARSGGGSSRSRSKATPRRGSSRGKSGASSRSRGGGSQNRRGVRPRGGGG